MYDPRNRLTIEVNNELVNHLGKKVYRTVIPRNVRLAEAPSFGLPVIQYDRQSKGAIAYLALAGELLRRADEAKALKCS
jgi:chromosome partitioning protein